MKKEDRVQVLQMINEWVRFADTKAGAISALNGVILTIIFSQSTTRPSLTCSVPSIIFHLGIALVFISLVVAANVILPNLKAESSGSRLFFDHIAKFKSDSDYEAALNDPNYNIEQDISSQIWNNSRVAVKKYDSTYFSIILGLVGYGLITCGYLQG